MQTRSSAAPSLLDVVLEVLSAFLDGAGIVFISFLAPIPGLLPAVILAVVLAGLLLIPPLVLVAAAWLAFAVLGSRGAAGFACRRPALLQRGSFWPARAWRVRGRDRRSIPRGALRALEPAQLADMELKPRPDATSGSHRASQADERAGACSHRQRHEPALLRTLATQPKGHLMRPTIILVHGAFAESASWDGVIDPLLSADHPVIAAANPLRGPAADARAVSDLVRRDRRTLSCSSLTHMAAW